MRRHQHITAAFLWTDPTRGTLSGDLLFPEARLAGRDAFRLWPSFNFLHPTFRLLRTSRRVPLPRPEIKDPTVMAMDSGLRVLLMPDSPGPASPHRELCEPEFRWGWASDRQADTFNNSALGQGLGLKSLR